MKLKLAVAVVAVALMTGCAQAPVKPATLAQTFIQAYSREDIDSCLGLMADNIEYRQDPSGVIVDGKDQLKTILQQSLLWHTKLTIAGPIKVSGNNVTFPVKESSDYLTIAGLEYVVADSEFQVSDGKINSWHVTLSSEDSKRLSDHLAGGIGVKIEVVEQGIKVVQLAQNSPAYATGIRQGDVIIAVNNISCSKMRAGEAQLRISGPVGSKVILTVVHGGSDISVDIEVVRAPLVQMQY